MLAYAGGHSAASASRRRIQHHAQVISGQGQVAVDRALVDTTQVDIGTYEDEVLLVDGFDP